MAIAGDVLASSIGGTSTSAMLMRKLMKVKKNSSASNPRQVLMKIQPSIASLKRPAFFGSELTFAVAAGVGILTKASRQPRETSRSRSG